MSWWFREAYPKWLTLTNGQALVGGIMGLFGFVTVEGMSSSELQFALAIVAFFVMSREGYRIVKTRPDEE